METTLATTDAVIVGVPMMDATDARERKPDNAS